jgi:hypothetical protein
MVKARDDHLCENVQIRIHSAARRPWTIATSVQNRFDGPVIIGKMIL